MTRAYRKAASMCDYAGSTFRLTDAFIAELQMTIALAVERLPTDVYLMPSTEGPVPFTLAEMTQLRSAVIDTIQSARTSTNQV